MPCPSLPPIAFACAPRSYATAHSQPVAAGTTRSSTAARGHTAAVAGQHAAAVGQHAAIPQHATRRPLNSGRQWLLALCAALLGTLGSSAFAQTPAADTPSASTGTPRATTASGIRTSAQMPAGFLFLYDADGGVQIQRGGQPVQAQRQQTLDTAEPIRVTLAEGGKLALAFSNGVGMWAKGPGSFTIRHFGQIPFQGNSRQNPYEPTSSALEIDLERGTFSFAERQLSALSAMRLNFGNGQVLDAHETASFLIEVGGGVQGNRDRISVLNGRALLHSSGQRGSAVLIGSGQFLLQERGTAAGAQQLRLPEQLTTTQQELDAQTAHHAQMVNDRIWFVREAGSDAAQAQVVVPVNFWLGKPHAATRIR